MKNELYYDFLFPSLVTYTDNEIDDGILDYSKKLLKKYSSRPFYSSCQSTVQTFGQIFELKEFFGIKQNVIYSLSGFCDILNIKKQNLKFIGSWLNYYAEGEYQDLHTHSDSMISGVIYLKGTGEKDLVFQAPWHFYQPRSPEYVKNDTNNSHNIQYESVTGRCYLFMSHMMHRTLPAKEERISLSFNISY